MDYIKMAIENGDTELAAILTEFENGDATTTPPATARPAWLKQRQDFITALFIARREAHLTQQELATKAGLPQSTVARIEAGKVDPQLGTLVKMAAALGVSVKIGKT